jgi:hypothetical protein
MSKNKRMNRRKTQKEQEYGQVRSREFTRAEGGIATIDIENTYIGYMKDMYGYSLEEVRVEEINKDEYMPQGAPQIRNRYCTCNLAPEPVEGELNITEYRHTVINNTEVGAAGCDLAPEPVKAKL